MRRVVAAVAAVACHASRSSSPASEAGPASDSAKPAGPDAVARFSRPIAAVRGASGFTFVAGLVVPRRTIAVTELNAAGATIWTRDLIGGVSWTANATLTVLRSSRGAIVVFRGRKGEQEVTLAHGISVDGQPDGESFAVGAAACTTDAEMAWIERGSKTNWRVETRSFGASASSLALTLSEDRDPSLFCASRRVFALGDGESDVTLSPWGPAGRTARVPPLRVIEDADFQGDEERGHEVFEVGDTVGVVRVGSRGTVAAREVTGDHAGPWRRFGARLTEADDVALVDADGHSAIVAFTREMNTVADAGGGSSVEALVWERGGARDVAYQVAPADGSRARGPYWSGAVAGGVVVGWAERSAHEGGREAPVLGMAYRLVSIDGLGVFQRLDRPADELVDAGCDDAHCYAVALARGAGEDGGQPEVAEVLTYP